MKITKKFLKIEYNNHCKGIPVIAKETGHSASFLYKKMHYYGIKMRGRAGRVLKNYTGKKFGQWLVVKKHPTKRATWVCICGSCNVEYSVKSSNFLSGCSTKCNNCKKKGCGEITGTFWANVKNGADQRKLEFLITVQEAWDVFLKQNRKCALTGMTIGFEPRKHSRETTTASLDRIDSTKGYTKTNVQWVYKKVNMMKQGYSQSEFIDLCKLVARHNV